MRKALRTTAFAALALVLLVLLVLAAWEPFAAPAPDAPPPRAYRAEIVRDEWGVPHIHGRTDADVAFGVAWAHAEDDFATLQNVVAMTRGRYGAIAGEAGAATDYAFHLVDARGTVERRYAPLPADVRALLEAYAAGLNRYAAAHPAQLKLARLFPVDGRDIAAGFALRSPFFFGLDKVIGPLTEDKPPPREHGPRLDRTAPVLAPAEGEQDTPERPGPLPTGEDAALAGSNAFAIAPARSGDGVTRLVSNTHQPWRGGTAWYELTVRSDEGWHFAGATFPGSPFPLLGHNETLGWTNTVNRPDLIDIYKLVLDEDRSHYRLDGKWLPLEQREVLLPVRLGPLTLPVSRTVYRSRHGPVIVNRNGAFAVRFAGIDRLDQLVAYYRLNKARDYAEWEAALRPMGVPSTNFVYADRAGNIAYIYNAAFPQRSEGPNWRGVLPGDRSELIWDGTAAFNALPKYLNPTSGYVFNANNTPFLAAGGDDLDPARTSPLLGVELDLTNRAVRADKLLAATPEIGRAELERIKYDTGYERYGYVAALLDGIAALDLRDAPELARGQKLLAGWDMTADGRGQADALAVMVLKEGGSASYNLRAPPKPRETLDAAVRHLMRHFGRIDPPLGTVLRLRQGKVDLPMDGGSDTLRAATSWDVHPDGRLSVRHGDSFLMFVEWAPGAPVQSQSIMPFGAATTRPGSRHFTDQAPLFVRHQLKPVHFTREDVLAHAVRRYVVQSR